jgi:hypothetical protein
MSLTRLVPILLAAAIGSTNGPTPKPVPCQTYVAGNLTARNKYALSVDDQGWPLLQADAGRIELVFLVLEPQARSVELVHVYGSSELERWELHLPAHAEGLVRCVLSGNAVTSTCGATIHILPHKVGGYYYLRSEGGIVEAALSFVLCG